MTILSFCEFSGTKKTKTKKTPDDRVLKKGTTVIYINIYILHSLEACGNLHRFIKSCNNQEWVGRQQVFLMLLSGKVKQNWSK